MGLAVEYQPIPITTDEHGTMRVGGSRVSLDIIVDAYKSGWAAEEITRQYSTLDLADIHAAISYYLKNKSKVETYLEKNRQTALALRREIEAMPSTQRIREKLLLAKAAQKGIPSES